MPCATCWRATWTSSSFTSLSQEEVEPELVGDLRLVDCEDDEVAEITISAPLLKRYKDNLNAFVGGAQGMVHAARDHLYLYEQPISLLTS